MRIGLHYHIPYYYNIKNETWHVPAYFGVFINELLEQVDQLVVFGYTALPSEISNCDFSIPQEKFEFVNLGPHNSVPERLLRSIVFIKEVRKYIDGLDSVLIRTPTPMIIASSLLFSHKIQPLIVGEYDKAINSQLGIKGLFLKVLYKLMRKSELNLIRRNLSFTNSAKILEDYSKNAHEMKLIKTTTITFNDAFPREDTVQNDEIQLLYVGRLDPNKNIIGLLRAVAFLNGLNTKRYVLNLVYLNDSFSSEYQKMLKALAFELGINNDIIFHGQKRVGDELNKMYRMADIFVLASLDEGFPRVIWETMINSCPVIATKVGSIPYYLEDKKNALLIDPGVDFQIIDAIELLASDASLRKRIIKNAFELVKENTIEIQTKILLSMINVNQKLSLNQR
jgi:glycosyltransferase involved in cell wall biosynthesis